MSVSSQAARKGSHWPLKMEGRPSWAGNSGKLTALKPRCRVGPDLGRGQGDVLQPGQLEGDDAIGVGARPCLEVPVVEGAQAGQPELGVLCPRVDGAAEARDQRREAERSPDPGPVHVLNAGLDVEATRTHFVEAGRFHAPFVAGAAHHGVEADVGVAVALEDPGLGAIVLFHHPGGGTGQGSGQTVPRRGQAAQSGGRRPISPGPGSAAAQDRAAGWPVSPARCRRLPREGDTIVRQRRPFRGCA